MLSEVNYPHMITRLKMHQNLIHTGNVEVPDIKEETLSQILDRDLEPSEGRPAGGHNALEQINSEMGETPGTSGNTDEGPNEDEGSEGRQVTNHANAAESRYVELKSNRIEQGEGAVHTNGPDAQVQAHGGQRTAGFRLTENQVESRMDQDQPDDCQEQGDNEAERLSPTDAAGGNNNADTDPGPIVDIEEETKTAGDSYWHAGGQQGPHPGGHEQGCRNVVSLVSGCQPNFNFHSHFMLGNGAANVLQPLEAGPTAKLIFYSHFMLGQKSMAQPFF
jgi:hypothetical protein